MEFGIPSQANHNYMPSLSDLCSAVEKKIFKERMTDDRGLIIGRDRPKFLKQVVTAPLPNARQQV